MSSSTRGLLVAVFLSAGVFAGLGLGRAFEPAPEPPPLPPARLAEPPAALVNLQDSFHAVAETVMPAVVHITMSVKARGDFFQSDGIGSGVIVSGEGHILTNNHVVNSGQNLTALRVRFVDGREFKAEVVGTDSESDLAVLKISVPRNVRLSPLAFADSDKVRVGDWCLAIGSPFGYNHTMTAGIVSAKHRRAEMQSVMPYQDFIQTDAAINPGNSGGALVNIRGELIGVNTAIISETRSSDGVGLAIPSNLAKWVMERLREDKRIRRGYLGVSTADITQELVDDLKQADLTTVEALVEDLGLKEPRGAFVFMVQPDTPAAKAGFRRGDVILELNGEPVAGQSDLMFKMARVAPGTKVSIKLVRDRKERTLQAECGERPPVEPRRRPR